jgi:hypothetical protein
LLKEFGFLSDGDLIEVKPSDLKGTAQGEAASATAALLESARGKVLFIDEAYGLDPTRHSNGYGGEVIDTLVEKLDRSPGADIAVILAGYEPQMRELFKNANNSGFASRFNMDECLLFEDMSDEDLKKVLLNRVSKEGFIVHAAVVKAAVQYMSQRRRMDGFSNAAEVEMILNRAKVRLAARRQAAAASSNRFDTVQCGPTRGMQRPISPHGGAATTGFIESSESPPQDAFDPFELLESDFIRSETSAEKAHDAIADLENMEHVLEVLRELEDTMNQAKLEGRSVAEILDDAHMIFTGGPGTGKVLLISVIFTTHCT